MTVTSLTQCRELLALLDGLRAQVLSGQCDGVGLCIKRQDGSESVVCAGSYKSDPQSAAKAAMRASWELTKLADAAQAAADFPALTLARRT